MNIRVTDDFKRVLGDWARDLGMSMAHLVKDAVRGLLVSQTEAVNVTAAYAGDTFARIALRRVRGQYTEDGGRPRNCCRNLRATTACMTVFPQSDAVIPEPSISPLVCIGVR